MPKVLLLIFDLSNQNTGFEVDGGISLIYCNRLPSNGNLRPTQTRDYNK